MSGGTLFDRALQTRPSSLSSVHVAHPNHSPLNLATSRFLEVLATPLHATQSIIDLIGRQAHGGALESTEKPSRDSFFPAGHRLSASRILLFTAFHSQSSQRFLTARGTVYAPLDLGTCYMDFDFERVPPAPPALILTI